MADIERLPPINYVPPGDVAYRFMNSDAFVRGIRGPVGSGKSTTCVIDTIKTALMQKPGPDGVRRYRCGVIRNTYGELETTTINTFHDWIPRDYGDYLKSAPIVHRISGKTLEAEWLFLALDRPEHVRKLLSLELTQAWINEAREVPKAILDHLTARVGRYPRRELGGATRAGIIMDTNSPDQAHWWAQLADFQNLELKEQTDQLEKELRKMGVLGPNTPLIEFFTQPSAENSDGSQNMQAENLGNLPPGYYVKAKVGKSDDWIRVYVRNEYHFVMDGKAVYDQYRDNIHVKGYAFVPQWPIDIGMDFGLTPAAVFSQQTPSGQVRVLSEFVSTRMGIKTFGRELKLHLQQRYPGCIIRCCTGDPAGTADNSEEHTAFNLLRSEGVIALPASTNDPAIRIEAVNSRFGQLIDGEPALAIHPDCLELRKGCGGGYHFKRIQTSGEARYDNKPYKNMSSHICEALQYDLLGIGVGRDIIRQPQGMMQNRPAFAGGIGQIKNW